MYSIRSALTSRRRHLYLEAARTTHGPLKEGGGKRDMHPCYSPRFVIINIGEHPPEQPRAQSEPCSEALPLSDIHEFPVLPVTAMSSSPDVLSFLSLLSFLFLRDIISSYWLSIEVEIGSSFHQRGAARVKVLENVIVMKQPGVARSLTVNGMRTHTVIPSYFIWRPYLLFQESNTKPYLLEWGSSEISKTTCQSHINNIQNKKIAKIIEHELPHKSSIELVLAGHVGQASFSWSMSTYRKMTLYRFDQELITPLHPQLLLSSTVRTCSSVFPCWIRLLYLELCCYTKM